MVYFFRDIFSILKSSFWEIGFEFFFFFLVFPGSCTHVREIRCCCAWKTHIRITQGSHLQGKRDVHKNRDLLKTRLRLFAESGVVCFPPFSEDEWCDAAYFRLLYFCIFFLIPNSGKTKCVDHRRISRVYVGDVRSWLSDAKKVNPRACRNSVRTLVCQIELSILLFLFYFRSHQVSLF